MLKLHRREFIMMTSAALAGLNGRALAQNTGPFAPHPGLEITTSFTNSFGPDADSWTTVTSVTPQAVEVGYRSARGVVASRQILEADRQNSATLVLGYASNMPHVIPHTTSMGISSASLNQLRANGSTPLAIIYETTLSSMNGQLTFIENMKMPVLVEDTTIPVRAIHAHGVFRKGRQHAEGDLYLLDSQNNALLLQYTLSFRDEIQPRTERITRVTAGRSERAAMEQALRTIRRYDLYGIHFDFDRATIQPQARSLMGDVAVMMNNNPAWRLRIVGHTDSIGDANYNLRLSAERAASVKAALVRRGVAADRLTTSGVGESDPKASNKTLQGRALNRRVELIRTDS